MIARRNVLQLAGVGAVTALAADARSAFAAQPAVGAHGGSGDMPTTRPADAGTHPALEKFSLRMPRLRTARPALRSSQGDVYISDISELSSEIYPGLQTSTFGYFGQWVPPVIRARKGKPIVVVQRNKTSMPVSVHLHGGVNRAAFDGQMSLPIQPGGALPYVYDNDQDAATLWMHDHVHMMDAHHVYAGMASPYIITSPEEEALGLPTGEYDIPLMLRDGDFGSQGQLIYTMDDTASRTTIMVNGRPWPHLPVQGRRYRFRVINASNMRFFVLGLSDGSKLMQVGGDHGLLPAPVESPVVVLSPGERAELVVDFAAYAPGSTVDLINYIGPGDMTDVGQVMRFVVGDRVEDSSRVPDVLLPSAAPKPATVQRRFVLRSSEPGEMPMTGTINGKTFDMDRIDTTVTWGTTEEWEIVNENPTIPHNFHTHLAHFRVVSRSERPVGPEEAGLKDTVQIFPGQSVRLRLTFDKHRGVYPYHCHMIDHGAMGMMAQMKIV